MAGFIHVCGVIFYGIFASGELQPWSEPPPDPNHIPNWKLRQMSIKGIPPDMNGDISGGAGDGFYQGSTYGATGPPQVPLAPYGQTGQQQTSFYDTRNEYSQPLPTDRYMHGSVSDREY